MVRDLGYHNELGYWYQFDEDDLEEGLKQLRGDAVIVDLLNSIEGENRQNVHIYVEHKVDEAIVIDEAHAFLPFVVNVTNNDGARTHDDGNDGPIVSDDTVRIGDETRRVDKSPMGRNSPSGGKAGKGSRGGKSPMAASRANGMAVDSSVVEGTDMDDPSVVHMANKGTGTRFCRAASGGGIKQRFATSASRKHRALPLLLKRVVGNHYENSRADVDFLSHKYMKNFKDDPTRTSYALQQVKRDYNIDVPPSAMLES